MKKPKLKLKRLKARRCEYDTFREWAWDSYEEADTRPRRLPVDDHRLSVADRAKAPFAEEVRPYD